MTSVPADHMGGDPTRPLTARARIERLTPDEARAVAHVLSGLDLELHDLLRDRPSPRPGLADPPSTVARVGAVVAGFVNELVDCAYKVSRLR